MFQRTTRLSILVTSHSSQPPAFTKLWLIIQVRNPKSLIVCTTNNEYCIVLTYRPPDTPLSSFDADLKENFIYALSFNMPVYILGDLNCRLENSDNPEAKAVINFCRSNNLTQLIIAPTRVTGTSKSIRDVILASDSKQVQKTTVMESSISDHDLVYVTLKLKKARSKPVYITTRSYKQYNPEAFYNDVSMDRRRLLMSLTKSRKNPLHSIHYSRTYSTTMLRR